MDPRNIRNFSIIAHIDHGKSTLADRLLEHTQTIAARDMTEQLLDQMDLERERGITIKLQAVQMRYRPAGGSEYQLNLIDTPGHVDFTYEVSRSLAACEGALLVVDAAQGVEAQTLANVYLALEHDLTILPVINKIDLPSADVDMVRSEITDVVGLDGDAALLVSAKEGTGVDELLQAIVDHIPPPEPNRDLPLRALIFDSHYDPYKGVIAYVRIVDGAVGVGEQVRLMATGATIEVLELGVFRPRMVPGEFLEAGEVGYIATGSKNVRDVSVGDTMTSAGRPASEPLAGYRPATPMVFAGLFPIVGEDYTLLRDALDKLRLNDASLNFEPENSDALGFGFRVGFLGLLHMEIVQERLEREYNLELLTTAPSVEYHVTKTDRTTLVVDSPSRLPDQAEIAFIEEPWVSASLFVPPQHVGTIMELAQARRGIMVTMDYIADKRVVLKYDLPLSELIVDFYDELKSRTQGYGSLDYSFTGYREGDVVKVDLLVGGKPVDALSVIVPRAKAQSVGRNLVERLKAVIPRQLFDVAVQAAVGNKVIARQSISALRKNVLAKCYGGDVTRKRKLLEKQREGKQRMKRVGNVEIPQEAFMAVLNLDE
ncbi:MAG TPA: translation elongation factor 4 [Chloroflexota bacterium]|jgi:GTP-binding protein LepA|nr:translation elongation factor 4 [Chloroflexota bacterium]